MPERCPGPLSLLAGLAVAGAIVAAVDAFIVEPSNVEVTYHDLSVPELPPGWAGERMIHLTDLHYGDPRSDLLLRWMVETVNALEPDLIVLTGDYAMKHPSEVAPCVRYLAQLRSRRGLVGVLGDHDFDLSTQEVFPGMVEGMRRAGIRVLRNDATELDGLRIAGVEPSTRKQDLADLNRALRALNGRPPHLLLSHSPDIIPEASDRGVPLVLCGHTHGGQVVVPFFGPPVTHSRVSRAHASGWSSLNGTRMYTGRGLASHASLRFLCRPEITVFTLREG